jgi:hypothetical protein
MMTDELVPKIHLGYAANTLTTICNAIDNGADLDETMLELFETTATQLSEGVDRRKGAARYLKGAIEQAKAYEKQVTSHRKQLETALTKLKAMTKEIVEANPDIPFKDGLGKKLSIAKNGKASLVYDFDFEFTVIRDVVSYAAYEYLRESEYLDYIEETSVYTLNTGKLRADLEAGKKSPVAHLEHGSNLRGL